MELEKFLEYQGFDPKKIKELEEDKAKAEFDTSFIHKDIKVIKKDDIYKELIGGVTGSILTKIKSYAKESEIDLDPEEIKEKPVEDIAKLVFGKIAGKYSDKITELQTKVGQTDTDAIKNLEKEIEKQKKLAEDYKGKFTELGITHETYKTTVATDGKNKTLKELEDKVFNSVKFKQDISTYEKKGFITDIKEKFKLDLDETGTKLLILDKEGKGISNPNKAGTIFEPEELLQAKAIEAKLFSINPHTGTSTRTTTQTTISQPERVQRPVNQRAL